MLHLPVTTKTTELFHSFGIETAKNNIILTKINLYTRLRANEYTNNILLELNKLKLNETFTFELKHILNVHGNTSLDALDILSISKAKNIKDKVVSSEKDSTLVNELKVAYEIEDPKRRTLILKELLKTFEDAAG